MRLKCLLLSALMISIACEIPDETVYDNPLDVEGQEEKGITMPALVFFPDTVSTIKGSTASFQVFALEVLRLGSAFIQIKYDKNMLGLSSVAYGTFFSGVNNPIFIYENDSDTGTLDIFTSYLGSDSVHISGTGNLATLIFSVKETGYSDITYTELCEFVTPLDEPIIINGFGKGVVDAR